ncbi:hypothetical protein [Paenibacillus sp. ACRRY]|uniref:hypothetical protein n=1 Tax=Paenibacillus sp. ACRRY TaxID=2918208 RepID=UPI001EF60CB9|nr:hypothetical protein [Paenibacillus sp. ACRRY]
MKKKLIITLVLVVTYFFIGWVADNMADVTVMSTSGLAYITDHHLFYDEYTFYNETGILDNSKINLRLEKLFLLGTAIVFIGLEIFKKSKIK